MSRDRRLQGHRIRPLRPLRGWFFLSDFSQYEHWPRAHPLQVWTRDAGIQSTSTAAGYTCLRYAPRQQLQAQKFAASGTSSAMAQRLRFSTKQAVVLRKSTEANSIIAVDPPNHEKKLNLKSSSFAMQGQGQLSQLRPVFVAFRASFACLTHQFAVVRNLHPERAALARPSFCFCVYVLCFAKLKILHPEPKHFQART